MGTDPPVSSSLLKLQIGPVQEFIAQARSTRDLWSGSYLLSWLMAAGIAKLLAKANNAELIYPSREKQPLIDLHLATASEYCASSSEGKKQWLTPGEHKDIPNNLLTPNIPNVFVARLPRHGQGPAELAEIVAKSIRKEWLTIAEEVLDFSAELGINDDKRERFLRQARRFLSITWQVTPEENDYAAAYSMNAWQLDAVRQTRLFEAWGTGKCGVGDKKDSLSGKEESIAGGPGYQETAGKTFNHLFKHPDHLGAVNLIKRVWHIAYLQRQLPLHKDAFKMPCTRDIAAHRPQENSSEENVDLLRGDKYFAVLALDGDEIGKWIGGDFFQLTQEHHQKFSSALSVFALERACSIVDDHKGRLIYAGGDDVLALLPADTVLDCARKLRKAFQKSTREIQGREHGRVPDCSVGICMAHFKSPLQDVIREAQHAQKRAKSKPEDGGYGRSAVAVTLMKRSGEISLWGCGWESGGMDLYAGIEKLLTEGGLSRRFPHRVCELLSPYLNSGKGLSPLQDADGFDATRVLCIEVGHAIQHQGLPEASLALQPLLNLYLESIQGNQEKLKALIGLCTTIAFAHRIRQTQDAQQPNREIAA